jgi:hypothetical protein
MLRTARPPLSVSEYLSILWWRQVITATRRLNRFLGWVVPRLQPLKPYWWVPIPFSFLGFSFGLTLALILA